MDNEMIKRVGAAIETYIERLSDARNYGGFINEIAIEAIKAMREPTEKMKSIEGIHWNYGCHVCGGLTEGWYAMIDAVTND